MRTGRFKKFHKVVFGWPCLLLKVTFASCYEPLIGVVSFLTAVAVASHYGIATGSMLLSLLATRSAFPGAFDGGLVGAAQAPLAVIPVLARMKAAPTASSTEACQVAMLSSSLIIFGCL
jgi:hypothetical protein